MFEEKSRFILILPLNNDFPNLFKNFYKVRKLRVKLGQLLE